MSESLTIELFNKQQAWAVIKTQLFPFLSNVMQAGGRWVLTVSRMKRTKKQNKRYWGGGVLKQIAEQAVVNGKQFSADVWHEFAKRKFLGVIELPDGGVVSVSSTNLTTEEFSDYCSKVEAWAASELGVVFYDLEPKE
jgi:hypothetical protein